MLISASSIFKNYKYFEKPAGFTASLRSLFKRKTLQREALKPFSFEMEKGEFLGLMGPNGAGKSTLIKVLTGIIARSGGELSVLGVDPYTGNTAFKDKIAVVMGQKSQLWWDLPAADTLLLQKSIYAIKDTIYQSNLQELTELFDVRHLLNVPVRQLSLGERMKFELICALLHDPELLFLDEPTLGLDASAQLQIRRLLKQAGERRGISVLLTSHYVQDLTELCPRVMVIRSGEKIYDGGFAALLRAQSAHRLVTIDLLRECDLELAPEMILSQTGERAQLRLPNELVGDTLAALFSRGIVRDIHVEDEDVTTLVEQIYEKGA